jgi:hypothetical protein
MDVFDWKFQAMPRSSNFQDVIKQGPGVLNIIDFMEIYTNFWEIAGMLAQIHDRLNGAIAIIAIQKQRGRETARGGDFTLEKPRLYISIENGVAKIIKAKNWKTEKNPNRLQLNFKLAQGGKFYVERDWHPGD